MPEKTSSAATRDILGELKQRQVRFLLLQFTDLLGVNKAVEVPPSQFERALAGEVVFDGSALEGFARVEEADALLVAKHGVDGVYDSDPKHNPDAVRFTTLTYEEAIAADIRIMDTSAFVLANEQALTMHVFDVAAVGVMKSICEGGEDGTRITAK